MIAIDPAGWLAQGLPRESRKVALTITLSLLLHAVALAMLPPLVRDAGRTLPSLLEVRLVAESATQAAPAPAVKESRAQQAPAVPRAAAPPAPAAAVAAPGALPTVSPPLAVPVAEASPAPHPAPSPEPVTVTPPDLRAAYLSNPHPPYPLAARRRGLEGRVTLRAEVLENGSCGRISVAHSSGHEILDQAALQAVKQWRFVPAQRGGEPMAAWVEVPIAFRLEDAGRG